MESIDKPGAGPLEPLFRSIVDHAGARTVYGEPISLEGRTILPVAKIRYGFGGGSGLSPDGKRHGGGGGGGLISHPVGVFEVTASQTRFIPVNPVRTSIAALGAGICLGWMAAQFLKGRKS